ncbi:MAG TPA: DUF3341 domain-containing protein [Humisphaera sp.]|jgi:hypothetical protein|nr:DUF3341 domain-containing protein [Humisphaera sp.]
MSTLVDDIQEQREQIGVEPPLQLVALLAEFKDVTTVTNAAYSVRSAGYRRWDVHSPFPIHGIDDVMGTRPTILPWLVLVSGLTGLAGGLLLQWWTNAHDYKFMISGKPYWSLPANIPIIFECTVLFSALMAVFGMLGLNRLPTLYQPIFKIERFRRVTNDRFFIYIDATDPKFDEKQATDLLKRVGASAIDRVED